MSQNSSYLVCLYLWTKTSTALKHKIYWTIERVNRTIMIFQMLQINNVAFLGACLHPSFLTDVLMFPNLRELVCWKVRKVPSSFAFQPCWRTLESAALFTRPCADSPASSASAQLTSLFKMNLHWWACIIWHFGGGSYFYKTRVPFSGESANLQFLLRQVLSSMFDFGVQLLKHRPHVQVLIKNISTFLFYDSWKFVSCVYGVS